MKPVATEAIEQRSLSNPTALDFSIFGALPSTAGVAVSPATAMRCTAVRASVEAISEAVGGLPLHLYERGEDGGRNRANDHAAYGLLHDEANDWTSANSFREQLTRDALLWGNGYGFINRNHEGRPVELIRLQPSAVTVDLDPTTSEPRYRLNGTQQRHLDRRNVLHIAAPSIDGVSGASPVTQCREAIATNLAIEKHVSRLFANQGRPSEALVLPGKYTPDALAKLKASWRSMIDSGMPAFLEEGTDYKQLTFTSADAQTIELWQHSVLEICRAFRVPPHMVFELGRATWGNASEMGASFLRFTLDRWLKVWTGEVRLKLIAAEDRSRFYSEFLTDDLLRADFATRATAYGQYRSMGAMTANEVRAGLNLPPLPDGNSLQNPYTTTGKSQPESPKKETGDE